MGVIGKAIEGFEGQRDWMAQMKEKKRQLQVLKVQEATRKYNILATDASDLERQMTATDDDKSIMLQALNEQRAIIGVPTLATMPDLVTDAFLKDFADLRTQTKVSPASRAAQLVAKYSAGNWLTKKSIWLKDWLTTQGVGLPTATKPTPGTAATPGSPTATGKENTLAWEQPQQWGGATQGERLDLQEVLTQAFNDVYEPPLTPTELVETVGKLKASVTLDNKADPTGKSSEWTRKRIHTLLYPNQPWDPSFMVDYGTVDPREKDRQNKLLTTLMQKVEIGELTPAQAEVSFVTSGGPPELGAILGRMAGRKPGDITQEAAARQDDLLAQSVAIGREIDARYRNPRPGESIADIDAATRIMRYSKWRVDSLLRKPDTPESDLTYEKFGTTPDSKGYGTTGQMTLKESKTLEMQEIRLNQSALNAANNLAARWAGLTETERNHRMTEDQRVARVGKARPMSQANYDLALEAGYSEEVITTNPGGTLLDMNKHWRARTFKLTGKNDKRGPGILLVSPGARNAINEFNKGGGNANIKPANPFKAKGMKAVPRGKQTRKNLETLLSVK